MTDPAKLREAIAYVKWRGEHDKDAWSSSYQMVVGAAASTLPKTRKATVYRVLLYRRGYEKVVTSHHYDQLSDAIDFVRSAMEDGLKIEVLEPRQEEIPV